MISKTLLSQKRQKGGNFMAVKTNYEANGNKCDKEKLPESINVIVSDSGDWYYLPSPINPLNWSISSFGLAIQSLYEKIN